MFDLEENVRAWRQVAGPTLGNDPQVLDELESHLRDEFDRLLSSGHAPAEAWAAAIKHLGRPRQIRDEFLKLDRPSWMPAKLAAGILVGAVLLFACLLAARLAAGAITLLLAAHIVTVTAGYGAVIAVGFIGACSVLRRATGPWEERHDVAFRFAGRWLALVAFVATSIGVVLGAWWSHDHLGRWWGWDVREIGGECVLVWSGLLVQGFRSTESSSQSRMCLAVSGNMIVALAWFGPLLQSGSRGYGSSPSAIGMALSCFLVSQMLLISLALAAPGLLRRGRSGATGG
jgi:hypothetical protein